MAKHKKSNKQAKDVKPKISLALNWLGALFLLMFVYGCLTKGWIIVAGNSTFGTVTDIKTVPGGFKSAKSYAIVLEYQDAAGETQTYASNIYTTPALYDLGERVPLWYWRDWVLLKQIHLWTNTLLSGVFGLFFVLVRYLVKNSTFKR